LAQPVRPAVADDRDLIFGYVSPVSHNWRYGLLVALFGIPLGFALFTLREPEKGANESSHILKASGMDLHSQQEKAPRVLLARRDPAAPGALALLRARGRGHPGLRRDRCAAVRQPVLHRQIPPRHASRSEVYAIIGLAAFLGLPLAYVFGDRYFRRAPQRPLVIAGICITPTEGFSSCRSTCPSSGCA